jgi:hypothetical protein
MAGRRFDVLAMTAAEKSELTAMASRPKTARARPALRLHQDRHRHVADRRRCPDHRGRRGAGGVVSSAVRLLILSRRGLSDSVREVVSNRGLCLISLHSLLRLLGCPESDLLAGRDFDGFAGRRVPPHPSFPRPHLQDAETSQADFVTLLKMLGGERHQIAQHGVRVLRSLAAHGWRNNGRWTPSVLAFANPGAMALADRLEGYEKRTSAQSSRGPIGEFAKGSYGPSPTMWSAFGLHT